MRSIWKGHIRFSMVTIPVRLYTAVKASEKVQFDLLHKKDHGRVGYDKRCKKCNERLTMDEIVKGYEHREGEYALIEPEDLENLKLKSTKVLDIAAFVDPAEIDPALYETPYLAGPDGEVAEQPYRLLRYALEETGKVAVGKIVLRDREDMMVVAPNEKGLMLYRLRYPEEVRHTEEVPGLEKGRKPDEGTLKMARVLVEAMTSSIDKVEFKDEYKTALRAMVSAKVKGKEVVAVEEEEGPKEVPDIMSALKESIERARGERKPMVRAEAKERKAAERPARKRKRKAA